jgi:hypothetical protein
MDKVLDHTSEVSAEPLPLKIEDTVMVLFAVSQTTVKIISAVDYGRMSAQAMDTIGGQEYKHIQTMLAGEGGSLQYVQHEWLKWSQEEKPH